MEKRRYTKIQALLPVIEAKLAEGQSQREIERELGLEGDRPIHNLLRRERKRKSAAYQRLVAENQQKH